MFFSTTKFAPMAVLQSRCMDYPYVNWRLRCIADDTCILGLYTKRLKLVFEITPLAVQLKWCGVPGVENLQNTSEYVGEQTQEVQHLIDKEFTPGYLLLELQKCGINLLPRDEDAKLAGIELKDRGAEERAILDVANSVRAFHFRRAAWNQGPAGDEGIGPDQVLLKLRENLEFDRDYLEDYEPDWRYVSWWNNKCAFQKGIKDTDTKCDAKLAEGQVTRGLLSQAIESQCSLQAYQTSIDYTQVELANTVKQMLRLLRLFQFS